MQFEAILSDLNFQSPTKQQQNMTNDKKLKQVCLSLKKCGCPCGRKNWGAHACAADYENVWDVRGGADKNPHTLNV